MKQIKQLIRQIISENQYDNIHWSTHEDEDRLVIEASLNGTIVARATLEMLNDGYGFDLEDFDDVKPLDRSKPIMKLESILVINAHKGQGLGKLMMEEIIEETRKRGFEQMFLNASPMGWTGLTHSGLVAFYKKFGFEEIENQGGNTIMGALI